MNIKKYILLSLMCCLSFALFGQKTTARATIEPSDILIGEQAIINLEVIAPKGRDIIFYTFPEGIVKGVEVLGIAAVDTTMTEVMTINVKYVVTSFDSTLYHIPYIPVLDGNDTIYTNGFGLKVSAPQLSDSTMTYLNVLKSYQVDSIDFEQLGVKDVKDIHEAQWTIIDFVTDIFLTYAPYAIGFGLFLILAAVALLFLLRKKKKGYYFKPEIILPPHIVALGELDKLKNSKMWQQGLTKEYYTQLTDIIREYIERRYSISAPEMTSDEILEAVHRLTDTMSSTENLTQILKLADFVKFAKYTPRPDEDDLSLVNAYFFVNQTKIEEEKPEAETEAETSTEGSTTAYNKSEKPKANS